MKIRRIDNNAVFADCNRCSEFRKFLCHGKSPVAFFYFKAFCSGKSSAVFCPGNCKKNRAEVRAIGNIDFRLALFKKRKIFFIDFIALIAFGFKTGYFNFASEKIKRIEKSGV